MEMQQQLLLAASLLVLRPLQWILISVYRPLRDNKWLYDTLVWYAL